MAGLLTNALSAQPDPLAGIDPQTSVVHHLLTQYEADQRSLSRFYVVTGSPERRERFQQLNSDYLKQLEQLDFDRMTTDSRVDYLLFKRDVQEQLYKFSRRSHRARPDQGVVSLCRYTVCHRKAYGAGATGSTPPNWPKT